MVAAVSDPIERASIQAALLTPGVRAHAFLDPGIEERVVRRGRERPDILETLQRRGDEQALAYCGVIERDLSDPAPPLGRPATVFEALSLADPSGLVTGAPSSGEANTVATRLSDAWAGAAIVERLRAEGLSREERIVALTRIKGVFEAHVDFLNPESEVQIDDQSGVVEAALRGEPLPPDTALDIDLLRPDLEMSLAVSCGRAVTKGWNGSTRLNASWHLLQEAASARAGLSPEAVASEVRQIGDEAQHAAAQMAAAAVVEDMQRRTERYLRAAGVTELRVWRYGRVPRDETPEGHAELAHLPLISTTGSAALALQARDNASPTHPIRVIAYEMTVPVGEVISLAGTGVGTYQEAEAVLVGGSRTVRVAEPTEFAVRWQPPGLRKWDADTHSGPDYTTRYDPDSDTRVSEPLSRAGRQILGLEPPDDPWLS